MAGSEDEIRQVGERVFQRLGFAPTELLFQRFTRVAGSRARQAGHATIAAYLAELDRDGASEFEYLAQALTINETYFFREPKHFEVLRELLAGYARASGSVRILSAACSSGEEAYSIAITAQSVLTPLGRAFEVVGTDVDPLAIARARDGLYGKFSFREDAFPRVENHLRAEGDKWRVKPSLRHSVRFEPHNLIDAAPAGPFQVIFCRNMLMYLTPENRRIVVHRLVEALAPGGALVIGSSETLESVPNDLERIVGFGATWFRKRRPVAAPVPAYEGPPARVMMVSSSPLFRVGLRHIARVANGFEIVAEPNDAVNAGTLIDDSRPDVIVIDATGSDAHRQRREIKIERIPVLVIAREGTAPIGGFEWLELAGDGPAALRANAEEVTRRIRQAAARRSTSHLKAKGPEEPVTPVRAPVGGSTRFERLLLIGCSTGGPAAATQLLQQLPANLGLAILIVQHMPPGFTASFAQRLDRLTSYAVQEAVTGAPLRANVAYVAPGHRNTLVTPGATLRVVNVEAADIYVPNVDRSAHSIVASGLGNRTFAIILTGMGNDGAAGMADLASSGAATVVQDPAEAIVPGMVNAAIQLGGAQRVMPVADMASAIVDWARTRKISKRGMASSTLPGQ